MTIKKSNLITIIMTILLVHTSLVQRITSWQTFFYLRWLSAIVFAALFFVFAVPLLKKNVNILMMTALLLFCMSSLYSSYINRAGYMLHVGIFNTLFFIETFCFFKYVREARKAAVCINALTVMLMCYCFINDVLMFLLPENFYGNGSYFLYSKFYIAYLHMVLLILYECRSNKKKSGFWILWAISIIVCVYIECSTGVFGLILLFLFFRLPDAVLSVMKNEIVALSTMLGCSIVFLLKDTIIMIPAIRYFVTNILHETPDLNSRIFIYRALEKILEIKPLWGFGAENNYAACQRYLLISEYEAAPDAQNGLMDWMISYGRVGTIILLVVLFISFQMARKKNKNGNIYFLGAIYSFFILGSIEICFDIIFFFLLAGYVYLDLPQSRIPET